MKPRIAITLGDPSGIGPEIVSKALRESAVLAACEPVVIGDPLALALHHEPLPQAEMLSVPGLAKKLRLGRPSQAAGVSALESLRLALGLLKTRQAAALVTAPVSKESFHLAGSRAPGHTEWLAEETRSPSVAMLMAAGPLRALLMTRHLPLSQVSARLDGALIRQAGVFAQYFVRHLLKISRPRLVLCGLNPHAGDGGLLGDEEKRVMAPALQELRKKKIFVQGPYGADSVFRDMAAGKYDAALAAYHDQGMIPLKLHAPERLVNITLGLPFIRTSPGHGTAFDISGKGRADPRPMVEAICLAAEYARRVAAAGPGEFF